jgi:hypothetical protein
MIESNYTAIGLIIDRDHEEVFWKDCPVARTQPVARENGHPVYLLAGNLHLWPEIFDRRGLDGVIFLARILRLGETVVWMSDGQTTVDVQADGDHFEPIQTCEFRDSQEMRQHFKRDLKDFTRVEKRVLDLLGIDGRAFELPLPSRFGDATMLPVTTEDL